MSVTLIVIFGLLLGAVGFFAFIFSGRKGE